VAVRPAFRPTKQAFSCPPRPLSPAKPLGQRGFRGCSAALVSPLSGPIESRARESRGGATYAFMLLFALRDSRCRTTGLIRVPYP
jgi:hypothetical protein